MTFRFYPSAGSTTVLGSFTTDVTPAAGKFAVDIGPLPDAVFAADDLWLLVEVNGASLGGRQRVLPAARAARADTAGELTVTGTAVVVGNTESNDLEIGDMGHAGWAGVAHTNAADSDSYALLQNTSGSETIVNAAPGGVVRIRTDNTDRVTVDSTGKLDVKGNASVAGDVSVGDDLDVAGDTLLGYVHRSCDYPSGAQHGDCSCGGGERILSGGTYVDPPLVLGATYTTYVLRENRPLDESTWRVACIQQTVTQIGTTSIHSVPAVVNCGPINIICARVGN
jgi:hypothetical protein